MNSSTMIFSPTNLHVLVFLFLSVDIQVGPVLGTGAFNDVMAMRRLSSYSRSTKTAPARICCSSSKYSKLCEASTNTASTCTTSSISLKTSPKSYSYYANPFTDPEQSKDKNFQYSSATDMDSSSTQQQEVTSCPNAYFDDNTKYAMKRPKKELLGSAKITALVDLAIEAKFLSRLSHPYIVKLHGSSGGMPGSADFFIVVDRVQETLFDAITTFRRQRERLKLNGIARNGVRLDKKGKDAELKNDFDRRVGISCQLASALTYLHKHS